MILLRSYIMLSHSDIVLRTVFRANKISLRPKGVISLSQSENNTLCVSTENHLFFCFVVKGLGFHPKSVCNYKCDSGSIR